MTLDAARSFDILVCGALWVEYILNVEHPKFVGAKKYAEWMMKIGVPGQLRVSIGKEEQHLGGNGWRIASALAQDGYSVALWSNPLGNDPNARMFKRALDALPNLHLLRADTNDETPYVIRAAMPGWATLHFERLWDDTRVLPPSNEELPEFRAAIITDHGWLDPTSANSWNIAAHHWRKVVPVLDRMESKQEPMEWARDVLK